MSTVGGLQLGKFAHRARARAQLWREERDLSSVARQVRRERLTYLRPDRLKALEDCAEQVNASGVAGDFLECGVALGGCAVLLATVMGDGRSLHAYDVFGMIPPPTAEDPPEVHERYATIASGKSRGIGSVLRLPRRLRGTRQPHVRALRVSGR